MMYFIDDKQLHNDAYTCASIDDVVDYCLTKEIIAVDTETEGLDFTTNKMTMFQIGDEEDQFVIDTRVISIEPLRCILENENIVKIFHNAKFDLKFIRKWGNIECENIYDTMLVEKIINCGKGLSASLANTLKRHLNITLPKTVRTEFINLTTKPFTTDQIVYGANDVIYLPQIKDKQLNYITTYSLENTVELENKAVLAFADIEYNGLDLNTEAWLTLGDESLENANTIKGELEDIVLTSKKLSKFVPKYKQIDMFQETAVQIDINWDSPKQVLDVFQCYEKKLENVNGKELIKYKNKHEIIGKYIKYKESMKVASSYGEAFLKHLGGDGRIHTGFNQILDTGRVSSSKPNMQQIPADNRFRNCFTAPEGWSFVSADYSSQELNVIAFGSNDPVWISALERGEDLHSTCADLVYKDEWKDSAEDDCAYYINKSKCNCPGHKRLRTNVKTVNFGLAYGMGANKLAETLLISKGEAKQLIEDYFKAFPNIGEFLDKLANYGKSFGYIKTFPPFNRKRWFVNWFPKIWSDESKSMEVSSIERASKNTPIQGASADMTKLAMIYVREFIKKHNLPVKMVMTVHDQIDTICDDKQLEWWMEEFRKLMEKAANVVVTNELLKADVTSSKTWEK